MPPLRLLLLQECASEMELPLGDDTNDVDVNKVSADLTLTPTLPLILHRH
jgi:hypothetical protein